MGNDRMAWMAKSRLFRIAIFVHVIAAQGVCDSAATTATLQIDIKHEPAASHIPTGELIKTYQELDDPSGEVKSSILETLSKKRDEKTRAFARELASRPPAGSIKRHFVPRMTWGVLPCTDSTERYLAERQWGYRYLANDADYVNSQTLFREIEQHPCLLPFVCDYITSRPKSYASLIEKQVRKLDMSREGEYLNAWAHYLKLKVLKLTPEEKTSSSQVVAQGIRRGFSNQSVMDEFFELLDPATDLAMNKNAAVLGALLDAMPKMDGVVAECWSANLAEIEYADFDYFMLHAKKRLRPDQIDDILTTTAYEKFRAKYEKYIEDKHDQYHREINRIVNPEDGNQ